MRGEEKDARSMRGVKRRNERRRGDRGPSERGGRDNKPGELSRRSANFVKYAPIYQWRAYQLPLLPTAMTIKPANYARCRRTLAGSNEEERNEWVRARSVYLRASRRAHGPDTRSAFISHKFDMICAEYDNSYRAGEIAERLLPWSRPPRPPVHGYVILGPEK